MSSLGSQWRVIRHYLSLTNLHTEVEKLIRKLKPATPEQWDNLINKFEKAVASRVAATKDVTIDKGKTQDIPERPTQHSDIKLSDQELQEVKQQPAPPVAESITVQSLWEGLKLKKDLHLGKISKPIWKPNKEAVSKPSIQSRTAYVVSAVRGASSPESALRRTERLVEHLHEFPEARDIAIKEGAVAALLRVRQRQRAGDTLAADIQGAASEALALVGWVRAPRGCGPNVLALDGGGVRGIIAIEILRHLERLTGRPVHELFDIIVGVSTGAIIAAVLAGGGGSLEEARRLYLTLSRDMFGATTRLGGASRLVLTHSYYDTSAWERLLQSHLADCTLTRCNRTQMPQLGIVSCVVNAGARLSPFLFRSYSSPYRVRPAFPGTARAKLWQAVRASAAAPTYFEEFRLGGLLHQDGGIMLNNPAGVALHEARLLWGAAELRRGALVSVGTGRARAGRVAHDPRSPPPAPSSWRDKFNKILDSATDTEGVHVVLDDLLPHRSYYRLNPPLMAEVAMDEVDERKLDELVRDTHAYIRRNQHKFALAAARLTRPRSLAARLGDVTRERAARAGLVHTHH